MKMKMKLLEMNMKMREKNMIMREIQREMREKNMIMREIQREMGEKNMTMMCGRRAACSGRAVRRKGKRRENERWQHMVWNLWFGT